MSESCLWPSAKKALERMPVAITRANEPASSLATSRSAHSATDAIAVKPGDLSSMLSHRRRLACRPSRSALRLCIASSTPGTLNYAEGDFRAMRASTTIGPDGMWNAAAGRPRTKAGSEILLANSTEDGIRGNGHHLQAATALPGPRGALSNGWFCRCLWV